MSTYIVLGTLAVCFVILCILLRKLNQIIRAQAQLDIEIERNEKLTGQMNSIMQTQDKLMEIRNEKAPAKEKAPDSGDSASRIARLNGMSESSSGN